MIDVRFLPGIIAPAAIRYAIDTLYTQGLAVDETDMIKLAFAQLDGTMS